MSTENSRPGWDDRQGSDRPISDNPAEASYLQKAEQNTASGQSFYTGANSGSNTENVRQQEAEPGVSPQIPHAHRMTKPGKKSNSWINQMTLQGLIKSKKLRGKSSVITLLLLLFGGGGFMSIFFSPHLALINMSEVFTKSFNEQLSAIDERSAVLLRSKLKDVTTGSCGAIKIKCDFSTISEKQYKKFQAAGVMINEGLDKDGKKRTWYNGTRYAIETISYTDKDGKKILIDDPEKLQSTLLSADQRDFRSAMTKAYNPLFASVSDKVAVGVMRYFKISKAPVVSGETDEERQKKVDDNVKGVENGNAKTISVVEDEDGKTRYVDSDGIEVSKEDYEFGKAQAERGVEAVKNGGTRGLLTKAALGASIVGYMDSACTVYNSLRHMSALAKTYMEAQAARWAMAMVLNPGSATKVGGISEGDANWINNNLSEPRPAGEVIDESKMRDPGSAENPALMPDPEAGLNAYDSPGYKMAAYGDASDLSLRAEQFKIGGGPDSLFKDVVTGVAGVMTGGDTRTQAINEACGYIQSPFVRFTGLTIGVIAGIGTFGLSTALGVGGTLAFAMMLPYVEAQGASILSGNVFSGITGIDSGDAAAAGSAVFFGKIAQRRGMKPLSGSEAMAQYATNQASYEKHAEMERYMARATPLDINNPYSFMGSLASTLVPVAQKSKSSAAAAMMNVTSLIPTSFASLTGTAKADRALDADYYKKCNDIGYLSVGIEANPQCVPSWGGIDLKADPMQTVDWMLENKEISPDTGEALPDGGAGQSAGWNYAKFKKECTDRTMPYGENEYENAGDGSNCLSAQNEGKNKNYRNYTFDKSINDSMDDLGTEKVGAELDKNSGALTTDGWTLPVPSDFTISSGYKTAERSDHKGIDLAGGSASATMNKPIYAARDGVVVAAGRADGYGNWIVLRHDINGELYSTVYGHMYDDGVLVKTGDQVKAGDAIGRVGSNGQSTGAHLHFEVWKGTPVGWIGEQIDPTPVYEAALKAHGERSV